GFGEDGVGQAVLWLVEGGGADLDAVAEEPRDRVAEDGVDAIGIDRADGVVLPLVDVFVPDGDAEGRHRRRLGAGGWGTGFWILDFGFDWLGGSLALPCGGHSPPYHSTCYLSTWTISQSLPRSLPRRVVVMPSFM